MFPVKLLNLQPVETTNQDLAMKLISSKLTLPRGLGLLVILAALWASVVCTQAQLPFAPPTNPMAQHNALNLLLNQVNWFQNAARSASSNPGGAYGLLVHQFQEMICPANHTITPHPPTSILKLTGIAE
jgi:hypothetical protein